MRTMNIPYKLPDASAGMRVAAREVRESCHRSADENVYKNELTALPLGFDTNDDKTNQAATVIRVLYAHRLRALQDEINALLSKMQAVTSNPNTDSKLGKVGR